MKNGKLRNLSLGVWVILLGVILMIPGYVYIVSVGDEYEYRQNINEEGVLRISYDEERPEDAERIEVVSAELTGGEAVIRVRSKQKSGKVYVLFASEAEVQEDITHVAVLYVHRNGVITSGDFFGDCTGMLAVNIGFCVYLAVLLGMLIAKLRRSLKSNLYRYRNILYFGLVIFLSAVLLFQLMYLKYRNGAIGMLESAKNVARTMAVVSFPLIAVTAIMVTISNIQLIRKEGRTWRNMLGCILGIFLGILALMPEFLNEFLQRSTWIDVHNYSGVGRFVADFLDYTCGTMATYLECILLGTIIVSVKAARRIPAFDKDYIIIHGSQIRKDGTLTKLLQSRADRAIEFASMQKAATGKDITFVPSGGKGSDEVISEGEAIRNYLLEQGIPEEQILVEDKSVDTAENLKLSAELIRAQENGEQAKIAFATTNYHVFRAGMLGTSQGLDIEGIGSRTKRYFWVNAFVREFIATIYEERKRHAFMMGMMILLGLALVVMLYISNVVLS
ncbi:MAG: YdcF family protein [Lachnospiraceae bacterium]|nr:YdcF family protein [Lachnospiraceae bacterium]